IMLTNTFGVPAVAQGALTYLLENNEEIGDTTGTVNTVVGECNDSYLNSIRKLPVTPEHARQAINKATTEKVREGAIGAGSGIVVCGSKGGIGSYARIVASVDTSFMVRCLVLSNFSRKQELLHYYPALKNMVTKVKVSEKDMETDGSIMIEIATDVPVNVRQL